MKHFKHSMATAFFASAFYFVGVSCTNQQKPEAENETVAEVVDTTASQQLEEIIDDVAVEHLRKSLTYLGDLQLFSVEAFGTFEDLNKYGHRVDYELASSVTVQRPNKLRTERQSKVYHQVFYYDGGTFTLYNPLQKVYASETAPLPLKKCFMLREINTA